MYKRVDQRRERSHERASRSRLDSRCWNVSPRLASGLGTILTATRYCSVKFFRPRPQGTGSTSGFLTKSRDWIRRRRTWTGAIRLRFPFARTLEISRTLLRRAFRGWTPRGGFRLRSKWNAASGTRSKRVHSCSVARCVATWKAGWNDPNVVQGWRLHS